MARKTSKQLFEELKERLENKSSEEICICLGNYFSSQELEDFLDFLENEN